MVHQDMGRTAVLMLLLPCLRSLADTAPPHHLRLRGGGRRAAEPGGVRKADKGAFGTIRSSLAVADGGNAPSDAWLPGWA